MAELLIRTITLACPVDHAYDVFTSKIDLWWPRGHRKTRDGSLTLSADALIDRAPDGTEWVMGRVTKIEPPSLLALDWFPGSPASPTSVEVAFAKIPTGTEITVTHRPLAGSEAIWPQRVALFTEGWETVLPAFKAFIEEA